MSQLTELSATEMARLVRTREASPLELVRAHLDRAHEVQPYLNAFVAIDAERAMAAARDSELGILGSDPPAPLLGVPISIKSSISVAGRRCEAGSRLLEGNTASADAPLVQRLQGAGAIIIGSTNAAEMLMAYDTDNVLHGRTSNPWDLSRTPGGSSGGEAAAIASGCSAAGVGSDGGGSIRVPAHFTGICGLKPTPGRIPATGHVPACAGPSALLGVVGPMARTVADLQLLLQVMSGPDFGDPMAAPFAPSKPALPEIIVGMLTEDVGPPVLPETANAVYAAAAALTDAGLRVEPMMAEGLEQAHELWKVLFCDVCGLGLAPMVRGREADLSPGLQNFLGYAASRPPLTAEKLLQALVARDHLRARFLQQMERYRVLLAPVARGPAFRHGGAGWGSGAIDYLEEMRFTQWFNLLGNPAVVVPVGQSPESLPIGVQIVGRPYEEEAALAIAAIVERQFPHQPPPMKWRNSS